MRCAFSRHILRCYTDHHPPHWYTFGQFSGLLRLQPRTEKSTASTRGVCTVNSSRAEFRHRERKVANDIHDIPIPHERTENTIPHLFPSPDQPLLFSSFPLRPTFPLIASPFLFFLLSLSFDRLVRFESIFTIQETKWQVHGVEALSFATSPKSLTYEYGYREMDLDRFRMTILSICAPENHRLHLLLKCISSVIIIFHHSMIYFR